MTDSINLTATADTAFKSPIRQLTDTDFSEWLVGARALLRQEKLWQYS